MFGKWHLNHKNFKCQREMRKKLMMNTLQLYFLKYIHLYGPRSIRLECYRRVQWTDSARRLHLRRRRNDIISAGQSF